MKPTLCPVAPRIVAALVPALLCAASAGPVHAQAGPSAEPAASAGRDVLLVLNKSDATLALHDPVSGAELHRAATGVGPHEVAVAPDGRLAVVCDYGEKTPGNTLTVFDLEDLELRRTVDLGEHRRPHGIEFLGPREVVVTVETSEAIVRVDLDRGKVTHAISTGQKASHMLVLDPVALRAYVANILPGTVSAIDLEDGVVIGHIATGAGAEGIAITPDGREVWVGNRAADTLSVIDTRALEVTAELSCASFPIRVEITPDGAHALVTNAHSGDVAVFATATREERLRIPMQVEAAEGSETGISGDAVAANPVPIGIQIEPGGARAYVANANAHCVAVIDLATWEVTARFATGTHPDGMAWARLAPGTAARLATEPEDEEGG